MKISTGFLLYMQYYIHMYIHIYIYYVENYQTIVIVTEECSLIVIK